MIQRLMSQIERLEREAAEALDAATAVQAQLESARNEHSGYEVGMKRLRSELSATEAECSSLRERHARA
jgi:predicted  nucleic acid-binding Zn-ribbon protein